MPHIAEQRPHSYIKVRPIKKMDGISFCMFVRDQRTCVARSSCSRMTLPKKPVAPVKRISEPARVLLNAKAPVSSDVMQVGVPPASGIGRSISDKEHRETR